MGIFSFFAIIWQILVPYWLYCLLGSLAICVLSSDFAGNKNPEDNPDDIIPDKKIFISGLICLAISLAMFFCAQKNNPATVKIAIIVLGTITSLIILGYLIILFIKIFKKLKIKYQLKQEEKRIQEKRDVLKRRTDRLSLSALILAYIEMAGTQDERDTIAEKMYLVAMFSPPKNTENLIVEQLEEICKKIQHAKRALAPPFLAFFSETCCGYNKFDLILKCYDMAFYKTALPKLFNFADNKPEIVSALISFKKEFIRELLYNEVKREFNIPVLFSLINILIFAYKKEENKQITKKIIDKINEIIYVSCYQSLRELWNRKDEEELENSLKEIAKNLENIGIRIALNFTKN